MPQGEHHSIPIASIGVARETRQRRDLDDIDTLADSISRLGLIHAIVVTREHVLVAGERRLSACRALGWTHIPAQYEDELDEATLWAVELEENIKRKDITWQERNAAIVRYHELRGTSIEETSKALGVSESAITHHLDIAKEAKADPKILAADKFSVARGMVARSRERRAADESIHIVHPVHDTPHTILTGDFHTWAATYTGPKFNLIHCDFPYGILHARDPDTSNYSNALFALGDYADDPDIYWQLFRTLAVELDRFCAPSAHLLFWFSPVHYAQTWENLKLLEGFKFDEVPLIWHKTDDRGIAPDPARRPRRVSEFAFFGWRGDRKIIRLVNNVIGAPTERERHPHEKSETALRYFFRMCIDERSRVFDPTCGSGSALRAAKALGAAATFGIERDAGFAGEALRALQSTLPRRDAADDLGEVA